MSYYYDGSYATMSDTVATSATTTTTADKVSMAHVGVLKVVWERDRHDLIRKKEEVAELSNEVALLRAELDFQAVQNQLNAMHGTSAASAFVDFMKSLATAEVRDAVAVRCCVRSGNAWISVDSSLSSSSSSSSSATRTIRDGSFDNVLRSLVPGNTYQLQQLVPAELAGLSTTGALYLVPVHPALCVWLVGGGGGGGGGGSSGYDAASEAATALAARLWPVLEVASTYCVAAVVRELEERQEDSARRVQRLAHGLADLLLAADSGNEVGDEDDVDGDDDGDSDDGGAALRAAVAYVAEALGDPTVGCTAAELYVLPRPPARRAAHGHGAPYRAVAAGSGAVACLEAAEHSLLTAAIATGRALAHASTGTGRAAHTARFVRRGADGADSNDDEGGGVDDGVAHGVAFHAAVDGLGRSPAPPFVVAVPLWGYAGDAADGNHHHDEEQLTLLASADSSAIDVAPRTSHTRKPPSPPRRAAAHAPSLLHAAGLVLHFGPEGAASGGLSNDERAATAAAVGAAAGRLLRAWLARPSRLRALCPLPLPVPPPSSSSISSRLGPGARAGRALFDAPSPNAVAAAADGGVVSALATLLGCDWAMVLLVPTADGGEARLVDNGGHAHAFAPPAPLLALLRADEGDGDGNGDVAARLLVRVLPAADMAGLGLLPLLQVPPSRPAAPAAASSASSSSSSSASSSPGKGAGDASPLAAARGLYASSALAVATFLPGAIADTAGSVTVIAGRCAWAPLAPAALARALAPLLAHQRAAIQARAAAALRAALATREAEAAARDRAAAELQASHRALTDQHEALAAAHAEAERRGASLRRAHRGLEEAHEALGREHRALADEHAALEQSHAALGRSCEEAALGLRDAEMRVAELAAVGADQARQLARHERLAEALRRQNDGLQELQVQLEEELARAAARGDSEEARADAAEAAAAGLEGRLAATEEELAATRRGAQRLQELCAMQEGQLGELRSVLTGLRAAAEEGAAVRRRQEEELRALAVAQARARGVQQRGAWLERRLHAAWALLTDTQDAAATREGGAEEEEDVYASVGYLAAAVALATYDAPADGPAPGLRCTATLHWRDMPSPSSSSSSSLSWGNVAYEPFSWRTVAVDDGGPVLPGTPGAGGDFAADLARLLRLERDLRPEPFVFVRGPSPPEAADAIDAAFLSGAAVQVQVQVQVPGTDAGACFFVPVDAVDAHVVLEVRIGGGGGGEGDFASSPDGVGLLDGARLGESGDAVEGWLRADAADAADREAALLVRRLQAAASAGARALALRRVAAAAVRRADDRAALARRQLGAFLGCARAASGAIRVDAAALSVGLGGRLAAGYEESKLAGAGAGAGPQADLRSKVRALAAEVQRALGGLDLHGFGFRGVVLSLRLAGGGSDGGVAAGKVDPVLYHSFSAVGDGPVREPRDAYRVTSACQVDDVEGEVALLVDGGDVVAATLQDLGQQATLAGRAGAGLAGLAAVEEAQEVAEAALRLLVRRASALVALDRKNRQLAGLRDQLVRVRDEAAAQARQAAVLEGCHAAAERRLLEVQAEQEEARQREAARERVHGALARRVATLQAEKAGILQLNEAMSKELARTIWYEG